jgi:NAD(P)-dependent dehydrogenase (short-subunit alcohol dehydrogenase family)
MHASDKVPSIRTWPARSRWSPAVGRHWRGHLPAARRQRRQGGGQRPRPGQARRRGRRHPGRRRRGGRGGGRLHRPGRGRPAAPAGGAGVRPAEALAAFVGGGRARPGPVAEVPEQDWRSTVDGSLTATFLTLKSFLPGMLQRGRGAIVTMASSAARLPGLGAPAPYVAAKAGVVMLTRQVASEVGRQGCASTAWRHTPCLPSGSHR